MAEPSGWHLYGEPLPDNYVPTRIAFDAELAADQSLELPQPDQVRFELPIDVVDQAPAVESTPD